jgi:hypothetical protein
MALLPTVTLGQLSCVRSRRLGQHAQVGVVAHTQAGYDFLAAELTAARVRDHVAQLGVVRVERYMLPRVRALNFVLAGPLAGPVGPALQFDAAGRLLGTALLELELPRPDWITQMDDA